MRIEDFYVKTVPELFHKGLPGDPRLGDWAKPVRVPVPSDNETQWIIVWGCPDDLGVTSNRGRAGAKAGPDSIRKHLYRMTPPMDFQWEDAVALGDLGNLVPSTKILETQMRCQAVCEKLGESKVTLLAFGGGHDFAAPNFLGFISGLGQNESAALINIDPHLDVRPLENGLPHSGTPFRQILDSKKIDPKKFVHFGTRANRNARDHFQYCIRNGVKIQTLEALRASAAPISKQFENALKGLARKSNVVAVTIDMDGCPQAEGTSAAPVIGFSAQELVDFATLAGLNKKVRYFELAEVAPPLDPTERSSRIAAEVAFAFISARARVSLKS